jgi:hypothetical protein
MTFITREEAVREFGRSEVDGAEMVILMRDSRYDTQSHTANIGDKHWTFTPRQEQLTWMVANR